MNTFDRRRLLAASIALAVCAGAMGLAPAAAHAAASGKPIRLLVPFPPGGGGDRLGRLLAGPLGKALDAEVVVENQGGANGNIALQNVARGETDGSVLGLTLVDHIGVNPLIYRSLPYDPLKDFKGIGLVLSTPYVLAVAENGPRTLAEFMKQAAARPGDVSIGYPTTNIQIAMLDLQSRAKAELNLIPYRGIAQGLPDMLGGRLSAWVGTSVTMRGYIEGGKVRGLAVTSSERVKVLPDVPTVADSGYPGYQHVSWYGIVAPAGTPDATVTRLNQALNDVLREPAVRSEIERDGATVLGGKPEAFRKALQADLKRLAPIVEKAGIKPQ
ncbi:Bug family tripartite tricarboxylate transporter substrate binding protein [Bordetella genomosp. 13]|uniref:Bug family tripartite tricarboxylate transporter substrate binding protein n=1 Tax=Bordetella genomosp. 13 TaxID=463040 RepID=UPI0011A577B9|nr:tripartite tricarboxylate transporter substrate binding protein [Bordetella genomosp. 13]